MQKNTIFKAIAGFVLVVAAVVFFASRLAGVRPTEEPRARTADLHDSVTDAASIVPASGTVVGVERLDGNRFWVGQKDVVDTDAASYRELQRSWIVDTGRREATELAEIEFGYPGASVTSTPSSDGRYLIVDWSTGWEGSFRDRKDFVDRKNGILSYSLESEDDRVLRAQRGDTSVRISFDPEDPCSSEGDERATGIVVGIRVGETPVPFGTPKEIACVPNDMTGQSSSPLFISFDLSSDGYLRVGLPWGGALQIPADSFDAAQTKFVD
jgi:hypothetical protein